MYGILGIEDRGILFVEPGAEIYEGMIVGEHNRDNDIVVNICREKQLTNVRSATNVITSYSIHYTKLYEYKLKIKMCRTMLRHVPHCHLEGV